MRCIPALGLAALAVVALPRAVLWARREILGQEGL